MTHGEDHLESPELLPLPLEEPSEEEMVYEQIFHIDGEGRLTAAVSKANDSYHLTVVTDVKGPLILHWGVAGRAGSEWVIPPASILPAGTETFGDKAVRTPFVDVEGLRRIHIKMREDEAPSGVAFVLNQPETGKWLKDRGRNFYVPVALGAEYSMAFEDKTLFLLAREIIDNETGRNSWTLMHRYDLCYELLDKVTNAEGLALLYVWLRYSAIRQLDWQRNYNTKPRELAHAMDRLTLKLAGRYRDEGQGREIIRLIMTTLGRGGEGQKVRDEILNIMHRRNIKEVSGHFLEEWHQKLHNNTTPDDVVLCEAYLDFLRNNGDLNLFYRRLEEGGVTRQRLESYERPIRSHPDFIPHLKEALIGDFEHFLGILRAVHSGIDLGTSIQAARYLFDDEMHGLMDFVWHHVDDGRLPFYTLVEDITRARRWLAARLEGRAGGERDLIFLDLALEDFLRVVLERNLHSALPPNELVDLVSMATENICFSDPEEELSLCLRHWRRLASAGRFGKEWSLHAHAVVDRVRRAIGGLIDRYSRLFQPLAEFLGKAFGAAPWTITLFSEEVMRGRPAFVLSVLLRYISPVLRRDADLGIWQIISPGHGAGQLELAESLRSVQGKSFGVPTIIVTDQIAGDEEVPEDVTAIITSVEVDILSHLAVRARNAGILFAVCYDESALAGLKSLAGRTMKFSVDTAGGVVYKKIHEVPPVSSPGKRAAGVPSFLPSFTAYAISGDEFTGRNVGGKANNLRRLREGLPSWVHTPASAALPFGVFERVLHEEVNRDVAGHYEKLIRKLDEAPERRKEFLAAIRTTVLALRPPDELMSALYSVAEESGLTFSTNRDETWTCITRVWASKWNERAYLSRKTIGLPHEMLAMAVLIQRVVEADYAFVIHTVNPFTGRKNEIYAEVVLGLGETLVGNYPGRALSFSCPKEGGDPVMLSFPAKSVGLYGGGLIFRSDSNGEDLAAFAGAGLYDSFMLPPPHPVTLDYENERLLWDNEFRRDLLLRIAEIGAVVEKMMGSPQDIEGAYSGGNFHVVQSRPQVGIENG